MELLVPPPSSNLLNAYSGFFFFFWIHFGMLFTIILHASVWWDYATWVCLIFFSFLVPLHVNKRASLSSMRTMSRPPSRLPRLWGDKVVVLSPSLLRCAPGGSVCLNALFSSVFFGNINIREGSECPTLQGFHPGGRFLFRG